VTQDKCFVSVRFTIVAVAVLALKHSFAWLKLFILAFCCCHFCCCCCCCFVVCFVFLLWRATGSDTDCNCFWLSVCCLWRALIGLSRWQHFWLGLSPCPCIYLYAVVFFAYANTSTKSFSARFDFDLRMNECMCVCVCVKSCINKFAYNCLHVECLLIDFIGLHSNNNCNNNSSNNISHFIAWTIYVDSLFTCKHFAPTIEFTYEFTICASYLCLCLLYPVQTIHT